MRIITTHKNTDFDALASVVAATILYPDAVPVLPKQVNPNVKAFLSIHKDIFKMKSPGDIDCDKVDSLVVVDTDNWSRIDHVKKLQKRDDLEIIMWDHHMNKQNIKTSWERKEPMGANITLMTQQLKEERKLLTPIQSTLFLAGLYEDTGNLTFPSSQAADAYAAAYLLERKADLKIIGSLLRPAYGEQQKNVLYEMLENTDTEKINGIKVSINKMKIEGHVGGLSVVVSMYREIANADVAFGVFENEDRDNCIVIGRSDVDEVNVGAVMRSLGGGGHHGAGSAMLKGISADRVEEWIRDIISGGQRSAVQISDLMSFPVITVSSNTLMQDVAVLLREKGCTGVPVVDDGELKGVISRRDFKKLKKESQLNAPVKAFMKCDVVTISPDRGPNQAANLMVKHDIGRLPVIQDGKVIGIVTRTDAMRYFYDLLPD
ncbi:MAG: CBS domain-containing protein [Desulfobacterales bacterium]|nr:CBS domain-containing protein [Desulfobacterales bacterium]